MKLLFERVQQKNFGCIYKLPLNFLLHYHIFLMIIIKK